MRQQLLNKVHGGTPPGIQPTLAERSSTSSWRRTLRAVVAATVTTAVAAIACTALAQAPTSREQTLEALSVAGPYEVVEETYTLDPVLLPFPFEFDPISTDPVESEMTALVIGPAGTSDPRPVVLFAHGQNGVCYAPGVTDPATVPQDWPCAEGLEPVPSYRGFAQQQRMLASQGYVTVSISANAINADVRLGNQRLLKDPMRAALIIRHLEQLADWNNGEAPTTAPTLFQQGLQLDTQRLLLVGHSQGGSGANHASLLLATDGTASFRIGGQVLLAPTEEGGHNPAPVPTLTLLPACDGDVVNLQGQQYADLARDLEIDKELRTSVLISGANHNFFNSEWDPAHATSAAVAADDAARLFGPASSSSACHPGSPQRLGGNPQRTLSAAYIAVAGAAYLRNDAAAISLLDGTFACDRSTCGPVLTQVVGGNREPLLLPQQDTPLTSTDAMTATTCLGQASEFAEESCSYRLEATLAGRFPSFGPEAQAPHGIGVPNPLLVKLAWNAPESTAVLSTSAATLGTATTAIAMRVIVPPLSADTQFQLELQDQQGRTLDLGLAQLQGLPQNGVEPEVGLYWAQEVHFPIDPAQLAASGVNLSELAQMRVTGRSGQGTLWIQDVWGFRPGRTTTPTTPVRFEIDTSLPGGDPDAIRSIRAEIIGTLRRDATVYYRAFTAAGMAADVITVPAGATSIDFPAVGAPVAITAFGAKGIVGTLPSVAYPVMQ